MKSPISAALSIALPAILLTSCDNVAEMAGVDPRPTVEIQGELTVMVTMGPIDPNRGWTFGGQTVMVEYEPQRSAVIHTSPDTKFVNLKRTGETSSYDAGMEYLVRGYESEPVMLKAADGSEYYEAPRGVDRWIEATHVELLETNPAEPEE